jgi:hypothetical protein
MASPRLFNKPHILQDQLNQTVGGVNKGLIAAGAVIGAGAFALV